MGHITGGKKGDCRKMQCIVYLACRGAYHRWEEEVEEVYIGSVGQARVSPPASLRQFAGTCHAVQWVGICTFVLAFVSDYS